jgi:hypothetical protein
MKTSPITVPKMQAVIAAIDMHHVTYQHISEYTNMLVDDVKAVVAVLCEGSDYDVLGEDSYYHTADFEGLTLIMKV